MCLRGVGCGPQWGLLINNNNDNNNNDDNNNNNNDIMIIMTMTMTMTIIIIIVLRKILAQVSHLPVALHVFKPISST